MIRFGTISDTNNTKGLVRVRFAESDNIVSGWIPVIVTRAEGVQFSHPLKVNEHVACLMDDNAENGVCLGAIYDASNTPSDGSDDTYSINFGDGTLIQYNAVEKKVLINSPAKVEVIATNDVYLKSQGTFKLEATTVEIVGNLHATGEVKALSAGMGVKLSSHIHTEPDGTTGAPVPGT